MRVGEGTAATLAATFYWLGYHLTPKPLSTTATIIAITIGVTLTLAALALAYVQTANYVEAHRAARRSTDYASLMTAIAVIGSAWLPLFVLIALDVHGRARWIAAVAALALSTVATVLAMTYVTDPAARARRETNHTAPSGERAHA